MRNQHSFRSLIYTTIMLLLDPTVRKGYVKTITDVVYDITLYCNVHTTVYKCAD